MISWSVVDAAYISFIPQTITQPDGTIIHCFASGDEFNNWLHTEDGYTIIQDEKTGFFTYAVPIDFFNENNLDCHTVNIHCHTASIDCHPELVSGSPDEILKQVQYDSKKNKILNLTASKYIVGKDTIPNTIPKWLIPEKSIEYINSRKKHSSDNFATNNADRNKGQFYNLVIFIKFAGENDFALPASHYDSLFNAKNSPSLKGYYSEVSYNQLEIQSHILAANDGKVLTYTDAKNRNYYRPFTNSNQIGYSTDEEGRLRRNALLFNATKYIDGFIPNSMELDGNNDGRVDNVTYIFQGGSDGWGSLFWGQATSAEFVYDLKKKAVNKCVLIPSNQLTLGVIAHEIFHILGAPDLYRYDVAASKVKPVDRWDLMEYQNTIPQSMCAYMKYKYGNWISKFDTIKLPGRYKLNPLTKSTNNAFVVQSTSPQEYYMLEYRKPIGFYEGSLENYFNPNDKKFKFYGGLLAYRIDRRAEGEGNKNANANTPDEIYFYRPNGTKTENGRPWEAAFNARYFRNSFNHKTNPMPFLFNETDGGLSISDIYEQDTVLYFNVHFRNITFIKSPSDGDVGVRLMPTIIWDLLRDHRIYLMQLSTEHNFPDDKRTLEATKQNDSIFYVQENLLPNTYYYLRVGPLESNNTVRFWSKAIIFKTANVVSFSHSYSEICAGKTYNFHFDVINNIPSNSEFHLVLSDKNGKFGSGEIILGTITVDCSSFLSATIPANIPTGYHYAIKLVSTSNPSIQTVMSNVRILNTPEIEFLFLDSAVCFATNSNISFKPHFHNVENCYYKFEWSVSNCQIVSINDTNNSIEIFWNRGGLAEVRVIATNIYGCSTIWTKKVNVYEKPKINFLGKNTACGYEKVRYYFPEEKNIPTTVDISNGTFERINSDTIEITWQNRSNGLVKIKRTVGGGCSDSISFNVVIDSLPTFEIAGKMSFCGNDTVKYFSSEQDTVKYNFLWKIDSGGKIIGLNNGVECLLTGDFANNTTEEDAKINLSLTIFSKNGKCSSTVDTVILIFKPPATPVISELDSFLICSIEGVAYQWFCDDIEIANSNKKQIVPAVSGLYSVKVFDKNGCVAISEFYKFDTTFICQNDNSNYIIKTTDDHIFIYLPEEIERVDFELIDILGRVIFKGDNDNKNIIKIEKTNLAKGVYYIKLSHPTNVFTIETFLFFHLILRY